MESELGTQLGVGVCITAQFSVVYNQQPFPSPDRPALGGAGPVVFSSQLGGSRAGAHMRVRIREIRCTSLTLPGRLLAPFSSSPRVCVAGWSYI